MATRDRRSVALWLFACAAAVFATLVVGGVTRLTHSGLSIVEWQPLVGTLPPLSSSEWEGVFARYRRTPEYLKVNYGMSLEAFKRIFWWEWAHRALARANGVVFFAPFLYFLAHRRLDRRLVTDLAGVFLLGGAQGALGWYMVRSGLVDDPRVSHYRLTAHLGLAFVIFGALVWMALGLLTERRPGPAHLRLARRLGALQAGAVLVMVLSGGLVAGLRAGLVYNTFPFMDGRLVPALAFAGRPLFRDVVTNVATVQFDHRLLGLLLVLLASLFCAVVRKALSPPRARLASGLLLAGLLAQVALGAATVILAVPVALGAAHQAGAMLLFGLALWANHELRIVGESRAQDEQ